MKKQRIIDSEHASILKQSEIEEKKKAKHGKNNTKNIQNKKPKWQKQSEEFRAIMKANRPSSSQQPNKNYGS